MKELKTYRDVTLALQAGYDVEYKSKTKPYSWVDVNMVEIDVSVLDDDCTSEYRLKPIKSCETY